MYTICIPRYFVCLEPITLIYVYRKCSSIMKGLVSELVFNKRISNQSAKFCTFYGNKTFWRKRPISLSVRPSIITISSRGAYRLLVKSKENKSVTREKLWIKFVSIPIMKWNLKINKVAIVLLRLLKGSSIWSQYEAQKHDLFIEDRPTLALTSNQPATAGYLTMSR